MFIEVVGKVVRHAGGLYLKICAEVEEIYPLSEGKEQTCGTERIVFEFN